MIWPYLFALIFLIFGFDEFFKPKFYEMQYGLTDYFMNSILYGMFAVTAWFMGVAFGACLSIPLKKKWKKTSTTGLISLRDESGVSGSFFLGTGSIQHSSYYFFYRENGTGYSPGKVLADESVTIYEQRRQHAFIVTYTHVLANPWLEWIAVYFTTEKHEIFIPLGSITKKFSLR